MSMEQRSKDVLRAAAAKARARHDAGEDWQDLLYEAIESDSGVEEACDTLRGEADEIFRTEIRRVQGGGRRA